MNEVVTVRGRFKVSEHWPDYVAKPEEWVFLNIGVPGPTFIRLDTTINGMRQLQSTALRRGEFYDYEVKLKARVPGIWHVHPLVNVWEAGPVIGPAHFVEITGDGENFVNGAVLLNGSASMWSGMGCTRCPACIWCGCWSACCGSGTGSGACR